MKTTPSSKLNGVQEPSDPETKFLRDLRENLETSTPLAQAGNRVDAHVPVAAARAPERIDRPRCAVLVKDVGNIRASIDKQRPFLTLTLRLDQLVELTQLDEASGLRAQGNHDLGIMTAQQERVHRQFAGGHISLDPTEELQEPLVDVAELHLGVALGEALTCDEPAGCHRDLPLEV